MKITIIGGGSIAWTPKIVGDFLLNSFFNNAEICLMDINKKALDEVEKLCQKLSNMSDVKITFSTTTDMSVGIKNADYVVPAVAVGGFETTIKDHEIGRKYGFWNIKGHDIGPAGFSRTLRHVPFMVAIARLMEKLARPGAIMMNVTNPLVANTMSVYKYTNIRAYGFCHGVENHLRALLPLFNAESMEEVEYVTVGIDHCSWLMNIKVRGEDALQKMRADGIIDAAYRNEDVVVSNDPFAGKEAERLRFVIWDQLGYFPAISDDHICEFFPQFLKNAEVREHWGMTYDRIIKRKKTIDETQQTHNDIMSGKVEIELQPSGEIIASAIAAFHGHGSFVNVVNAPNIGQISNLPEGLIAETQCFIGANGIQPITTGALPDIIESIVRPILLHEKQYMEASYEWNKEKAIAALSTDPIVGDFINVKNMVDEYFTLNKNILEEIGIPIASWQ